MALSHSCPHNVEFPIFAERVMAARGDDDVVEHGHADELGGAAEGGGDQAIGPRRAGFAGRMEVAMFPAATFASAVP